MTSYIKGIYSYMRPGSEDGPPNNSSISSSSGASSCSVPTSFSSSDFKDKPEQQPGYLKKAVTGVASGIYSVGSGTVGVGVSSVRWVAGTTYSVGAGVVTGAGAVVGAVGSSVAAGASTVVSKVSGSKEHSD